MDGTSGSIDLQFKEESKDLYGKLALNGSTYGNGKAYADITSKSENFTLRAFAQTNLQYGKANTSETEITSRNGIENAMVFMDWQLTEKDLLKLSSHKAMVSRMTVCTIMGVQMICSQDNGGASLSPPTSVLSTNRKLAFISRLA